MLRDFNACVKSCWKQLELNTFLCRAVICVLALVIAKKLERKDVPVNSISFYG
jgi:hypothetical protein